MEEQHVEREFGEGTRETPDVHDKFLASLGYYRKHTALDASSLFRVVAEQHYAGQFQHETVRQECVAYMRSHRFLFSKDIKWGYEKYVNNVARPRTYGTLVELKAMALMYKANVFLFETFTEGRWFMRDAATEEVWNVFVGRDNHYDSVYTLEHMKALSECQSIVYEVLYESVFRMPDVQYAVERMLHDPHDTKTRYGKDEEGHDIAITEDGRELVLSKPEDTSCVLSFSHLCHFHNGTNYETIANFFAEHGPEAGYRIYLGPTVRLGGRKPNPLLPDKTISCVRQLLQMGITPFPYKVAKALDRNIYRNTEFDTWQDQRMEKWSASFVERTGNAKPLMRHQRTNQVATPPYQFMAEVPRYYGAEHLQLVPPPYMPEVLMEHGNADGGAPDEGEASGEYRHGFDGNDQNLTLVPYSGMAQYYVPSPPDQYGGVNAVNMMVPYQNQLMYGESCGQPSSARVPGCALHPLYPAAGAAPLNFPAAPGFNQQPQLGPLALLANVDPNEFLMLYEFYKAQLAQQSQQLEQQQREPMQQQQQQGQPQQNQQQQQQQLAQNNAIAVPITTSYVPWMYHYVPNGGGGWEANNTVQPIENPFLSPPTSPIAPLNGVPFSP